MCPACDQNSFVTLYSSELGLMQGLGASLCQRNKPACPCHPSSARRTIVYQACRRVYAFCGYVGNLKGKEK